VQIIVDGVFETTYLNATCSIEIIYEPKFRTYISGSHVWYCNVGQKFSYVAKNWIGWNYTENTSTCRKQIL